MKTVFPRIWIYLLSTFLKTFILSTLVLCLILFVARFQDIARFSAMVGNLTLTGKYILYQTPYLIPFALILSSFISAYLLGKNLSTSHELTAIRVAGCSLFSVFTPVRYCLLWIAFLCSLLTFSYHPYSKARITQLIAEVNTKNPFILLKNSKSHSNKRMYITFEDSTQSEGISNAICGLYNEKTEGLDLFLAEEVEMSDTKLHAYNATFISPQDNGILIEDIGDMKMQLQTFSEWVQKNTKLLTVEGTPFTTHFTRFLQNPRHEQTFFFAAGQALFYPLGVFTLPQVALYASLSIGRRRNWIQHLVVALSFLLTFTCYLVAKSLESTPLVSGATFLLPYLLLPIAIEWMRKRIERGALA